MLFLTMHSIDSHHGVGQRKRAKQGLHGRDLIRLFVAIKMRQHQRRVGSEGAEYVHGAAVKEVVEAAPQGFAVDRHMTLILDLDRVIQNGSVAAKRSLDRGGVELSQDTADRCVGWCFPPFHAERIAQLGKVNINKACLLYTSDAADE